MRSLQWCLSASFFKVVCKLVSLKSYDACTGLVHVKTIAVFVTCVLKFLLQKMEFEWAFSNSYISIGCF